MRLLTPVILIFHNDHILLGIPGIILEGAGPDGIRLQFLIVLRHDGGGHVRQKFRIGL